MGLACNSNLAQRSSAADSNEASSDLEAEDSSDSETQNEEVTPLLACSHPPMISNSHNFSSGTMVAMSGPGGVGSIPLHCHRSAEPDRAASRLARRQLALACLLCLLFVVGELLGGYYSGSLAIMADAAHMFSDFASFGVSLFVIWLSGRKPKKTMTYGWYRAEALGALATVVIIWYVTGILAYLAVERIHTGQFEIEDTAMVAVASAAVVFNIVLGLCLHGACCSGLPHGHSHGGHTRLTEEGDGEGGDSVGIHDHAKAHPGKHINVRAALIHVLGDFLQSVGVLISSVLIKIFGDSCKIADPICTLIFACIVLFTTVTILRDAVRILAEGAPNTLSYDVILKELYKVEGVRSVHDLHLWSLTADLPAASAHLAVNPEADKEQILQEVINLLQNRYNISKTTIQIEHFKSEINNNCAKCQPLDV